MFLIQDIKNVIEKAKLILTHPKNAWLSIMEEPGDVKNVINYLVVISIVPVLALMLGYGVIGFPGASGWVKIPLISAFFIVVVFYFLSALAIALTALMISFCCNYFQIEGKMETYIKLAGYSATAPLLANIFYLFPPLKFLKILGFFGCVAFFVGLPLLLKIPKDKELQFVVTVLVSAIVISIIFMSLVDQFIGPMYPVTL